MLIKIVNWCYISLEFPRYPFVPKTLHFGAIISRRSQIMMLDIELSPAFLWHLPALKYN